MGLRGSGSSADPGSWSTFSGSPASVQLLPTAPPRGVPTSTAGGGKGGGPELAETHCGREQAQRYHRQRLGEGAGILFHKEGWAEFKEENDSTWHTATSTS